MDRNEEGTMECNLVGGRCGLRGGSCRLCGLLLLPLFLPLPCTLHLHLLLTLMGIIHLELISIMLVQHAADVEHGWAVSCQQR